ncbi:triose-phosphate isomerase [Wenzhouxiangella limi]|uniref:Triosephosphate isomerase n=1 Tax=Wenzhouxiangella limi TaxID=2707351 RepID=A0A845V810_9GAMM|nr:triose-phosphate isomerase [Wenzhouxiangella limi]NDY96065.1 triose-phosphate isomerase [Wenzhouxiangella limi]
MRKPLIAGNWKMNGSRSETRELLAGIQHGLGEGFPFEVMVIPPYPYLQLAAGLVKHDGLVLGAQDLSPHAGGAYTGEVSGAMLVDCGCRAVLVGHSERRSLHGETDADVAAKFRAAVQIGLTPVLCVGETLAEREQGQTEAVVSRQLERVLQAAGIVAFASAVVAYEPVWAIGTGKTATPAQAQEVHAVIRAQLASEDATIGGLVRILYGGSVKPDNAAEIFAQQDIDGGLIGGASLDADSFVAICRAAQQGL